MCSHKPSPAKLPVVTTGLSSLKMLLLLKVYPRIYIYFLCGKEYWTKKSQDINCLLSIFLHRLQPHGHPLVLMFLLKQSKVKFIFYDDYLFYKAISQAVSKYWSIPSTSHPPTSHSTEQGFKVQFQYGQIILLPLISQGYPESHQQVFISWTTSQAVQRTTKNLF